jgi:hypothetical protein
LQETNALLQDEVIFLPIFVSMLRGKDIPLKDDNAISNKYNGLKHDFDILLPQLNEKDKTIQDL